jgi:hypothetical protein
MAERSVRHRDKAGNFVEPSEAVDTDWLPMRELHGGPEHSLHNRGRIYDCSRFTLS